VFSSSVVTAEPPHVHIERDSSAAKFWLRPVRLAANHGFTRTELRAIMRLIREDEDSAGASGMTSLPDPDIRVKDVKITRDQLRVDIMDGRTVIVPVIWFPRLMAGAPAERANWRLIGDGIGIHWPDLDEDISAAGLLRGAPPKIADRKRAHVLPSRRRAAR
jgi:hypothetical protein